MLSRTKTFLLGDASGNGDFLSGENEPMNIHRHWIEPRPLVCCVNGGGGDTAAINLVSRSVTEAEIAPGVTLPLVMNCELWGCGLAWEGTEHSLVFARGGLYYINWRLTAAPVGVWPMVVCLEDMSGQMIASCAGIGSVLSGSCVAALPCGARLRFVNRSSGAICLTEYVSGGIKTASAIQAFRIGD